MSETIRRRFWLEDETGMSIPLNGEIGIWLVNPTGLGVSSNYTFQDYRNGFFAPELTDKDPQQTVAGDLYFVDDYDPYAAYKRFIDQVTRAQTLILVYEPSDKQYRRRVLLNSLTKTELTTQQLLKAPVSFYGITPWYIIEEFRLNSPGSGGNAEPFLVDVGRVDTRARLMEERYPTANFTVYASGQKPAAFRIRYTGSLVNPTIYLSGVSTGTNYGEVKLLDYETDPGDTFLFSSEYDGSYIKRITSDGQEIDLLDNVEDLTKTIFPHIPTTEPCQLRFVSSSVLSGEIKIEVLSYYKGV